MAVCETPLFNDSEKSIANMNHDGFSTEAGTDTSSDTSAFLLSNTTKKKVCSSPRGKGTRRSSRLSKGQDGEGCEGDGSGEGNDDGDGDGTDYGHSCEHFSDGSDPHIDVTNVLMATEEKIFISEEKSKDRDRLEKQMLAVALVKSVVETKNIKAEVAATESELRKKPVSKQDNKDLKSGITSAESNGAISSQTVAENARIKTESSSVKVKTEIPRGKPLQATALPQTKSSIPEVATTALTNKAKIVSLKSVAVQNVNAKLNANAKTTAPVQVVTKSAGTSIVTTSKAATTAASVPTSAASMCAKGASTRARTRAAARTKVMGLKAEYASVKQTPRVAPKPSLPVPNPILALGSPSKKTVTAKARSITRRQIKSEGSSTIATPATASSSTTTTTLHKVKTARTKIATIVPATKLPDTISSSIPKNTVSAVPIKQETINTVSVKAKPVAKNSTAPLEEPMSTALPARKRIFSIDLDPEGFDFDLSLTMGMGGTDYTENATELPPITSTSYAPQNGLSKTKKESDPNPDANADTFRGRGMSFELFSFTTGLEASDLKSEALTGGRPRGDSIIFDPISFTDGGIHEENGLRKRNASPMFNGTDGIDLFNPNNSGFTDVPTIQPKIQPTNVPKRHPAMTVTTTKSRNKIPNPVSSHPANFSHRKSSSGRQSKSSPHKGSSYQRSGQSSSKKHHLMMSTNANGKDDTLHMPQGSAAAAAAAASLSSQIMQNTMNGTISHTSCPMELLNKGGRIGIYLPEARKERIAKFHSKRKNRIWRKRIKYDCRKKLADSRPRVKGRFVKSLEGED